VEGEKEGPGGEVLGVEVVEQGHVHRGGGGAAWAEAQDAAEAHQQRAQVGFEVLWREGKGRGCGQAGRCVSGVYSISLLEAAR
jgi:hypothetical protein